MDRWRRSLIRTSFGLALALSVGACHVVPDTTETPDVGIASLTWISDTVDPVEHLLFEPATCLATPDDEAVKRGELLFESPFILGGQAAKSGISCAACHRNGRDHPDFVLVGISGAPGTADVTNGFFSKHRADGVFNPVPIPDLASPEGKSRENREEPGTLEAFLLSQVVEEFDGSTPDPAAISDLAAYVRALDDGTCAPSETKPQTWRDEMRLLRSGARHIKEKSLEPSNPYVDAMRAALGRLNVRFQAPQSQLVRDRLTMMSRQLEAYPEAQISESDLTDLENMLNMHEGVSLYARKPLSEALGLDSGSGGDTGNRSAQ